MKYLNISLIALIVVSLGLNFYQWQYFFSYQNVISNKDALISNGYDEMVINYLKEIKEGNSELIKNQGRIEGILSVIHNYKPSENQYAAIWHDGYYDGLEQKRFPLDEKQNIKITDKK